MRRSRSGCDVQYGRGEGLRSGVRMGVLLRWRAYSIGVCSSGLFLIERRYRESKEAGRYSLLWYLETCQNFARVSLRTHFHHDSAYQVSRIPLSVLTI